MCLIHISIDFLVVTELCGVGGFRWWKLILKQQFCQVSIYLLDVIKFLSVLKSLLLLEAISHEKGRFMMIMMRVG